MDAIRGQQLTMCDGTALVTEVVSDEDSRLCLYVLLQDMLKAGDRVVGFETEWGFRGTSVSRSASGNLALMADHSHGHHSNHSDRSENYTARKVEHHIALLTFCTRIGCVIIRLSPKSISASLKRFLAIKDIIFVGVHIKEDVLKLKETYGLLIRNAVELSEWAAMICDHPRFVFLSGRELAHKIVYLKNEPKPCTVLWSNWFDHNLSTEQIECAAIDAYAAYKIGKKLMESTSTSSSVKRLFV